MAGPRRKVVGQDEQAGPGKGKVAVFQRSTDVEQLAVGWSVDRALWHGCTGLEGGTVAVFTSSSADTEQVMVGWSDTDNAGQAGRLRQRKSSSLCVDRSKRMASGWLAIDGESWDR